jgi:hypothetical protein
MSDLMAPPPNQHTEEQRKLIQCPHRYEISRRWWREQEAIAKEVEAQPLVRQLQDRLRRLEAHCTRCGVVRVLRYVKSMPAGELVVLKDDAPGIPGSAGGEGQAGEIRDERDDLGEPALPVGVVDETELPLRSRRR